MATKYSNLFHSEALQNLPKLEIFGMQINHLATLLASSADHFSVHLANKHYSNIGIDEGIGFK
jgi:hypothetical protein